MFITTIRKLIAVLSYEKPISERDMTIAELVKLYDEDPMHIVCLTCDD
jgi:hypothetical protein